MDRDMLQENDSRFRVSYWMKRDVFYIHKNMMVEEVAWLMHDKEIDVLPLLMKNVNRLG